MEFAKRFMSSLRRECLDHILIHEGRQLERVVKEYATYFNQERPHQEIDQRIPNHYELPKSKPTSGRITLKEILGGLHQRYSRTAYLN
jgi:putative transposase